MKISSGDASFLAKFIAAAIGKGVGSKAERTRAALLCETFLLPFAVDKVKLFELNKVLEENFARTVEKGSTEGKFRPEF